MLVLLAGVTKKAGKDYADGFSLPGTGSSQAQKLLARSSLREGSGDDTIVIHTRDSNQLVTDPAIQTEVDAGADQGGIRAVRRVDQQPLRRRCVRVRSAPTSAPPTPWSASPSPTRTSPRPASTRSCPACRRCAAPSCRSSSAAARSRRLKGSPVSGSVAIGLAAAAVVLLLAFGSLLATIIPLLAAIFAVGAGIETVGLLSHVLSINSITPSVAALIGIGVAVDYALFVVTRHRNGLRAGLTPEQSAVTALATSGRAVVFAGATVAIAMLGLLVLNIDFLTGVGLAAAITVALRGRRRDDAAAGPVRAAGHAGAQPP